MRQLAITANVKALTSRCGITSGPESAEAALVDGDLERKRAAKELKIRLPALVGLDWEKLFMSASPPGAPTPQIAKLTLTREANRRRWARAEERRAGLRGLIDAARAAVRL